MNFLVAAFDAILYKPLFNALVWIYNNIPGHDFGIAIILLTVVIRFVLYPLSKKAVASQKALQELQPKVKEIQEKYKNDKEKQGMEMLSLYKREKINPFSGFGLALIQLPILIALYRVFWIGPQEMGQINTMFLGLVDLSKPNLVFAILAGIFQFFQTKMLTPPPAPKNSEGHRESPDFSQMMQKQMLYIFPGMTVLILLGLPSAIGLYWISSGIFSIVQQYLILKKQKNGTTRN